MKKIIILICISTIISIILTVKVNAEGYDGFLCQSIEESEFAELEKYTDLKKKDTLKELSDLNNSIINFDVSNDGQILLCLENRIVMIVNSENEIESAYTVGGYGDYYAKWNNSNILIFLNRDEMILEFTTDCSLVDACYASTKEIENNTAWNSIIKETIKYYGDKKYILENDSKIFDLFSMEYTKLLIIDEDNKKTVVYDTTAEQSSETIVIFVFIFIFVITILYSILKGLTSRNTENATNPLKK